MLNTGLDPDPFFWIKTTLYLSLGLHKGRPSYKRSLQLSKENVQALQNMKFFTTFVGHFCPPGPRSGGSTDLIESGSNPDQDLKP
jgi:hypothetical protein